MIDKEYLCSFNCLEELAYAVHCRKPLVICVLDQEAWNLLTVVGSHEEVWSMPRCNPGALPLQKYETQPFGPTAKPFESSDVQELFAVISSVNFCPCRDLDCVNLGEEGVAARLVEFVEKDLTYTKEHAGLKQRADAWKAAGEPPGLLLERQLDVLKWTTWLASANAMKSFPPPTESQGEYVDASHRLYSKREKIRRVSKAAALTVIVLLMIASIIAAAMAIMRTQVAERQTKVAQLQTEIAVRQERVGAALLLSSDTAPVLTSRLRAVVRAANIASYMGERNLIFPALQLSLKHLLELPGWFFDISGHSDDVWSVAFSPDGHLLASGSLDGTVRITPVPQRHFEGIPVVPEFRPSVALSCSSSIYSFAWSPSGEFIAAGCVESSRFPGAVSIVRVWRRNGTDNCWVQAFDLRLPDSGGVRTLAWSPDSSLLMTGDESGNPTLWYIMKGVQDSEVPAALRLDQAEVPVDRIRASAWSPDGKFIAAGFDNVTLWHTNGVQDGRSTPVLFSDNATHDDDINVLAFSPDSLRLASGGDDQLVMIYEVPEVPNSWDGGELVPMKILHTLPPHGHSIVGLSWSSSGDLATSSEDTTRKFPVSLFFMPSVLGDRPNSLHKRASPPTQSIPTPPTDVRYHRWQ